MLYLNQREYRHIPYQHNMAFGGAPEERRNVATSGCGLCCACMVVDHLTAHTLSLPDCVKLAEEVKANQYPGVDLTVLGPALAERFGLDYARTHQKEEVISHLRSGGEAVVMVGNSEEEGRLGLFTQRKHYMLLLSIDEKEEVCFLDPAFAKGEKYDVPEHRDKVRVDFPFLYAPLDLLMGESLNCKPRFSLFKRRVG
jgi:hypothetical protein